MATGTNYSFGLFITIFSLSLSLPFLFFSFLFIFPEQPLFLSLSLSLTSVPHTMIVLSLSSLFPLSSPRCMFIQFVYDCSIILYWKLLSAKCETLTFAGKHFFCISCLSNTKRNENSLTLRYLHNPLYFVLYLPLFEFHFFFLYFA